MTRCVIWFRDGVGREFSVRIYWVAPAAYGGGGSPTFRKPFYYRCVRFLTGLSRLFQYSLPTILSP
jgi:hypothetical protein